MDGLRAVRGGAAGGMLVALLLSGCTTDSATTAGQEAPSVGVGSVPTPSQTPAITPEDQARADLEQLVRDYYAAENAVFLDPTSDPSAALDPYLRNPASAARVADVLSFRNAGHTLESRSALVHAVDVTALDLAAEPRTATLEECGTLAASGRDAESGEQASYETRGLTVWRAQTDADGLWKLHEYANPDDRTC